MLGGTWMPELIELAGGFAAGAQAGKPAPTVSLSELAELRPDVVLIKPCGFTIERTMAERELVESIAAALACGRGSTCPMAMRSSTGLGLVSSSRSRSWERASIRICSRTSPKSMRVPFAPLGSGSP